MSNVMPLNGSVEGQDIPVMDGPEEAPSMQAFQEAFGMVAGAPSAPAQAPEVPPAAQAPVVPAATAPSAAPESAPPGSTAQPLDTGVPAPAATPGEVVPLPDGQFGTFRDAGKLYKSWREASGKIDRQRQEERRLRDENEQLQRALLATRGLPGQDGVPPAAVPAPAPMPPLSQADLLQRFVNDPAGFQQAIEQQVAQKYVYPVVQALQSLVGQMKERQGLTEEDRTLYDAFETDGVFTDLRQDPTLQGLNNRQLLEIGKARMVQHHVSTLQAQVSQAQATRAARNARTTVETGGSQAIPAKTLEQMSEDELGALARQQWQSGERF